MLNTASFYAPEHWKGRCYRVSRGHPRGQRVQWETLPLAYPPLELLRAYRSGEVDFDGFSRGYRMVLEENYGRLAQFREWADGLKAGDNAKSAFMTRGLAEITRLGIAAGAQPLTFAGLAGLGDLVATCASKLSRNRYVGEQLAQGKGWPEISKSMDNVAEGVNTTRAALALSARLGVEMPITQVTYRVLFEGLPPREAAAELMERPARSEW